MEFPLCEKCQRRNSPLNTIFNTENTTDYILVCDNCYSDLRWLVATDWNIAIADDVVIWRRK